MSKIYRDDITGLRAVAVLAVVIFHIFPKFLKGGYLGVDIFFVISGFLITAILLREEENSGSINFINFYKKRLIRIWPATIVLLMLVAISAYFLYMYDQLPKLSKGILYSLFGGGNLYFYKYLDTSYFAPATNTNLLLHLWSLGVESQFYVFFPFIILIIKRKYILPSIAVLFIASIVVASIVSEKDLMWSYYMLPTRAFALLGGSVIAYITIYKPSSINIFNNKIVANAISILCLILILLSIIFTGEKFKLPNAFTLLVVIPTAILILIGTVQDSYMHRVLKNKIFIYIGLWSFSIYLYHWVLIAYWHLFNSSASVPILDGSIIFVVSIILGALSYYFVEQIFLRKKWNIIRVLIVFVIAPFVIFYSYQSLNNYNISKYQSLKPQDVHHNSQICINVSNNTNLFQERCITNKQKGEPNILIMGDSNTAHYVMPIKEIARTLGFSFRNMASSNCPFFTVEDHKELTWRLEDCNYVSKKYFSVYKNYDVIILSGRLVDFYSENNKTYFEEQFNKTIEDLRKTAKIIIIVAGAHYMDNLDWTSIVSNRLIDSNIMNLNSPINQGVNKTNAFIKSVADKYENVYYVDFNPILQHGNTYQYREGNKSLYSDINHFSVYGGEYIGKKYVAKGIDDVWYKVKKLYKDRIDIKLTEEGEFIKAKTNAKE